jgi:hypothetical protein
MTHGVAVVLPLGCGLDHLMGHFDTQTPRRDRGSRDVDAPACPDGDDHPPVPDASLTDEPTKRGFSAARGSAHRRALDQIVKDRYKYSHEGV